MEWLENMYMYYSLRLIHKYLHLKKSIARFVFANEVIVLKLALTMQGTPLQIQIGTFFSILQGVVMVQHQKLEKHKIT